MLCTSLVHLKLKECGESDEEDEVSQPGRITSGDTMASTARPASSEEHDNSVTHAVTSEASPVHEDLGMQVIIDLDNHTVQNGTGSITCEDVGEDQSPF